MIPSRIIGKATGENWIGLIDATYAIVLTLLVIELPVVILETLVSAKDHHHFVSHFVTAVSSAVIGYFAVFTIIYDVWAYHKALLADAIKLHMFAVATGWLLFISSLVSPVYYLINHFAGELIMHVGDNLSQERKYLIILRVLVFLLIALLYLILAILALIEKRQTGQGLERRKELHLLCGTALSKSVVTIAIAVVSDIYFISPPIPILTAAVFTYIPFNLFAINPLQRFRHHD
jgi:uncharacterized membrane protein